MNELNPNHFNFDESVNQVWWMNNWTNERCTTKATCPSPDLINLGVCTWPYRFFMATCWYSLGIWICQTFRFLDVSQAVTEAFQRRVWRMSFFSLNHKWSSSKANHNHKDWLQNQDVVNSSNEIHVQSVIDSRIRMLSIVLMKYTCNLSLTPESGCCQ